MKAMTPSEQARFDASCRFNAMAGACLLYGYKFEAIRYLIQAAAQSPSVSAKKVLSVACDEGQLEDTNGQTQDTSRVRTGQRPPNFDLRRAGNSRAPRQ